MVMRTYFVFKIKKEFCGLYSENSRSLYEVLRHLYYMRKHEMSYGFNLFSQLTEKIDKSGILSKQYIEFYNYIVNNYNKVDNLFMFDVYCLFFCFYF